MSSRSAYWCFGLAFLRLTPHRSSVRELLRLVDIELIVIALAFALEHYDLIVGFRDRTLKFGSGRDQILLCSIERLALSIQLHLNLFQRGSGLARRTIVARAWGTRW